MNHEWFANVTGKSTLMLVRYWFKALPSRKDTNYVCLKQLELGRAFVTKKGTPQVRQVQDFACYQSHSRLFRLNTWRPTFQWKQYSKTCNTQQSNQDYLYKMMYTIRIGIKSQGSEVINPSIIYAPSTSKRWVSFGEHGFDSFDINYH